MDNLINETNQRLQEIIDNLTTIKNEYESKLVSSNKQIEIELGKVKKYKEDFFIAKEKIEKMNNDIEGFEADYQNLVDRFKDDELANILIAANKEISSKIDERKRKIAKDKISMNELVEKAELSKNKLVKLTAEKRALELCLAKILDSYEFYTKALSQVIDYSTDNAGNLAACFHEESKSIKLNFAKTTEDNVVSKDDYIIEDNDEDDIEINLDEPEELKMGPNDIELDENPEIDLNVEVEDEENIPEEDIELTKEDFEEAESEDEVEEEIEEVKEEPKKSKSKKKNDDEEETNEINLVEEVIVDEDEDEEEEFEEDIPDEVDESIFTDELTDEDIEDEDEENQD